MCEEVSSYPHVHDIAFCFSGNAAFVIGIIDFHCVVLCPIRWLRLVPHLLTTL